MGSAASEGALMFAVGLAWVGLSSLQAAQLSTACLIVFFIPSQKYNCTAVFYIFSIPKCALWNSFMMLWTALGGTILLCYPALQHLLFLLLRLKFCLLCFCKLSPGASVAAC